MPVIAVVNRKGGSGKSTLATHLAAYYANAGVPVMLGDVDRQQSTQSWLRSRALHHLPRSAPIVGWAVDPKRVLRPPAGVSHVILDTPGGLRGFDLARVAAFADVILMPVCNSQFDRESAADCYAELMTLPRVASGRCKVAAVGMRLDARTKAAEVLGAWARGLKLPFIGVLREAQVYVRSVETGLTVFDLPGAQGEADTAQWKPIVAWLEPVLRIVRRPDLRTNASVQRPPPRVELRLERTLPPRALVREASMAAEMAAEMREHPAAAEPLRRRGASLLLATLFGWLTAPRFLHRNP
jgi:chromosome partitioning protein